MIQMNMLLGEPDYNFDHAVSLVRKAAESKPDVITMPETWNLGFFPKYSPNSPADKEGNRTKRVLGALAKEHGVNIIAGSVITRYDDNIFNTSYTFDRQGCLVASYNKAHLFSPMGEDLHFSKGGHLSTFELDGVRCGIAICYDIRFPEMIRTMSLTTIDILFVVAQWPQARLEHWQTLNKARAIENQIFVCCTNSVGTAGDVRYGGHSAVISPWGDILREGGDFEEIISEEMDLSIVEGIRTGMNIYRDRRPELYSGLLS